MGGSTFPIRRSGERAYFGPWDRFPTGPSAVQTAATFPSLSFPVAGGWLRLFLDGMARFEEPRVMHVVNDEVCLSGRPWYVQSLVCQKLFWQREAEGCCSAK
jgi:hypothetical protein